MMQQKDIHPVQEGTPAWLGFERKRWIKFIIIAVLYAFFVYWVNSLWFILGFPVLFDMYVSKRVNWSFWRPRSGKTNALIEWVDALIFAVIAVTIVNIFVFQNYMIPSGSMEKTLLIGDRLYVSKLRYGPKMPNTPLTFPFTQHTMPGTVATPSYLEWIKWPYKRLKGFTTIKNDDNVVFNFPEGDTVVVDMQTESYYSIVRRFASMLKENMGPSANELSEEQWMARARDYVWENFKIVVRPLDKKDNYIKRCVGIPGDKLEVRHGQLYINEKPQASHSFAQYDYRIETDGSSLPDRVLGELGIYRDDVMMETSNTYIVPLTEEALQGIKNVSCVVSVKQVENPAGVRSEYIFPHNPAYLWNEDNFGPLVIPAKGVTVDINAQNICLYQRIIHAYEGHTLKVDGDTVFIDGKPATRYTFAMDYYFMMGDNRHHSADSRYWGFVPEDHIVGSPVLVWLSLDKEKSFPGNIRFGRFFTGARR